MDLSTLLPDLLVLTSLICLCALSLVIARQRLAPDDDRIVEEINRLLPQTQCAQCGYPGCRPYAEAMAEGEAINLCPPGGDTTAQQLADMLGRSSAAPVADEPAPAVARIVESECIGCTLCIAACPVDAIIGAQQQMHTVIAEVCTGCELCIEPCPVDCIDLETLPMTEVPHFPAEQMACINCGFCETVCPSDLRPQLLYGSRQSPEIPQSLHLDACIECRRCDQVCPSQIPLTRSFQVAKQRQALVRREQAAATANEQRFLARQARLLSNQAAVVSRPSQKDRQSLLGLIRMDQ